MVGVALKLWRTDVEAMPPHTHYDLILALDVLEHLPPDELVATVTRLVALKTERTSILLSAPFGRSSVQPMHVDADEATHEQVDRLLHALPPDAGR